MKVFLTVLVSAALRLDCIWVRRRRESRCRLPSLRPTTSRTVKRFFYEGAKKEGRMMWYTSLTGGPNQEAPKVFEAKYPGIKVDVYRGDSDAIIQRVMQESQAKRYLVDTIETTFPILKVMQEYKLLAPYFSPHLASIFGRS